MRAVRLHFAIAAVLIATAMMGCPKPKTTNGNSGTSPAVQAVGGPPLGRYLCYNVPNYNYAGWVELKSGGTYEQGVAQERTQSSGKYGFNSSEGTVTWKGGSYEKNWPVTYYVKPGVYPDGSARTGTGSDRETLALKVDTSNPALPGQESFANPIYVYCYLGGT